MNDASPCTCPDCPAAREIAELRTALARETAANEELHALAQAVIDSEAAHHATVTLARKVFNVAELKRT